MNWLHKIIKMNQNAQNPRSDLNRNTGPSGGGNNHIPVLPIVLPMTKKKPKTKSNLLKKDDKKDSLPAKKSKNKGKK